MNNKIKFIIVGIALLILISGCVESPKEKEPVTPAATPATTVAPTAPVITATPQITATSQITPSHVSGLKELPPTTLFVSARMLRLSNWPLGRYGIEGLKVKVTNQQPSPVTINTQILNDQQVLQENSFTLEGAGTSYEFTNNKRYLINSTDVSLRLQVQGYKPVEYKIEIVNQLS